MVEPLYPLFSIASFLGFVLVLVPLPLHLQAWNSGTCFYVFWTSLACLNQFINSVTWANDALNKAPVWCDISTRIMLGAAVGIPASSLCIMRRLHSIAKVQAVSPTHKEKLRGIIIDSLMCILFPIVYMVFAYIVQGHRFDIYEQVGCFPVIYNTLPAYFLVHMWPIVLGLCSACFCVLILISFLRRQAQFSQFLSANSSLTASRYFRLMALACTEVMLTTPLAITSMVINATASPISPWVSWEDTHYDFSRVGQVPAVIWRNNHFIVAGLTLTKWSGVICAFIFFTFFGFATEARKHYSSAFTRFLLACRLKKPAPSINEKFGLDKLQLPLHSPTSSTSSGPATPPPAYLSPSADLKFSPSSSLDQNSLYMSYFKELPETPASPITISSSHCSSSV
ncbi:putative fungal pheromoneG-protein-coupled receptor [Thelephora terrestris]|uniref:Fungal pheromoneG-protein-coupled receptor n=1 Tax=Thelephora terrestris TaxID=56493 RepID=A0A9P6HMJ0_9AGAM|nr:putative fungal pheromoneG-protein-coupled receptor [Thelephora terrestris]